MNIDDYRREVERLKAKLKAYEDGSAASKTHKHTAEFWVSVEHMMKNDTDAVKQLIQSKRITKEDRDPAGFSLLSRAAYYGNLEICKRMLMPSMHPCTMKLQKHMLQNYEKRIHSVRESRI